MAVFLSLAEHSRYKYLTDIEQALVAGDFATATAMLAYPIDAMADTLVDTVTQVRMADGTGADYIVANYQQFYGLYMKFATASMDSTDTLNLVALANLCPERNGGVVYQARALYGIVFGDFSVFNDDSCMSIDTTYVGSRQAHNSHHAGGSTGTNQQYSLYPNPNDGNFTLQQYVPDQQPVKAVIYDALGRNIYTNELQFVSLRSSLNVGNYPAGLYLLEITDSKKQIFRFKFVITK